MTDHAFDRTETTRALRVNKSSAGDSRYTLIITRTGRKWDAIVCLKEAPNSSQSVGSFTIVGPDTPLETQPAAEKWLAHQCRDEPVRFGQLTDVSAEQNKLTAKVEFVPIG